MDRMQETQKTQNMSSVWKNASDAIEMFECVGSHYWGLVPFPAGCGECFGIARIETQVDPSGKPKTTFVQDGLSNSEIEALLLYGSTWDSSSSWRPFSNDCIVKRLSDGQLFWSTRGHGHVPFQAGKIVPKGLLNRGLYELDSLDAIRNSTADHNNLFSQ